MLLEAIEAALDSFNVVLDPLEVALGAFDVTLVDLDVALVPTDPLELAWLEDAPDPLEVFEVPEPLRLEAVKVLLGPALELDSVPLRLEIAPVVDRGLLDCPADPLLLARLPVILPDVVTLDSATTLAVFTWVPVSDRLSPDLGPVLGFWNVPVRREIEASVV